MSKTSVSGLQNIAGEIEKINKKVCTEIQNVNNKLDKLNTACISLKKYDNKPIAGDSTIKAPPVLDSAWSDENYRYLKYKVLEYEHVWQIEGYEEGIEITKYVEDDLKEMIDDLRTDMKQKAALLLNVATEIAKNQNLANKELAEDVMDLRKIASKLKRFSDDDENRVDVAAYRVIQGRKKIVNTALTYEGKIPYSWGSKPSYDGSIPKALDCSGFIQFAYYQATEKILPGDNSVGIYNDATTPISEKDLKPGDLAFRFGAGNDRHVGMYVGKDKNGNPLFVHENAGANNVSVDNTTHWTTYGRIKEDILKK